MARRPRPILLKWNGDVFVPEPSFKAYCGREYTVDEIYPMIVEEERSQASHNHYMSAVGEGFHNLSEENSKRFPTPTHLRKWCLVQCGYATETNFVLKDAKEARKLAAEIRRRDEYAVMQIHDNTLTVWDAMSQRKSAMKKQMFEDSKREVLDLIASMARTTAAHLNKEARHHGR